MIMLLLLSPLLYSLSFIIYQLKWGIFFFTVPLYRNHLTLFKGFLWGLCALGVHASGILYANMRMQDASWILSIISPVCIIAYFSLLTGLWFFVLEKSKYITSNIILVLVVTPIIHSLFFWFLSYGSFLPFCNHCEGYPFSNPLIPLINIKSIQLLIIHTNYPCALFVLFLLQSIFVFIKKCLLKLIYIVVILCCILMPDNTIIQSSPDFLSLITPLTMQFSDSKESSFPLEYLQQHSAHNLDKKIIISPESAFYCYSLFNSKSLQKLNSPGVTYILGSFSQHDHGTYNTLYLICNGTIIDTHSKQHTLLNESIPDILSFIPGITKPYKKGFFIKKAPPKHDVWNFELFTLEPYICSELFCHSHPIHPLQKNSMLLVCCNDSWFTDWTRYAAHLMVQDATFKALLWQKNIIYIGYQNALFISYQGNIFKIIQ